MKCRTKKSLDNKFNELIHHANIINEYIQNIWETESAPNIFQIKFDLGYDLGYELGLSGIDQAPLFKLTLLYLINHENIILNVDSSSELRVYKAKSNEFSNM